MGKVVSSAMMSLDGYIAKGDNTIGRLFDSLGNGDVEVRTASPEITFHSTAETAAWWQRWMESVGAIIVGRTLFDFTDGWAGRHTMDAPVVVVTHEVPTDWVRDHPQAPFTFVTDGVARAVTVAREIAGEKNVAVAAGTIAGQCLELGLLDEVAVDLVPVVMNEGKRYFETLGLTDVMLDNPTVCIRGDRVTHLVFPVLESAHASQPAR